MIFDVKTCPDLFLAAKDDRLYRPHRQSGRFAYLAVRQSACVRHDHDRPLFFHKNRQEFLEIRDFIRVLSVAPRYNLRDVPCLIENLRVAFRLALRLQEGRVSDLQQPADKGPTSAIGLQFVPCMQEAILCQVVGQREIAGQLAQEVSYMRLVAPDQLAEGRRVLRRDDQGDEILILAR